MSPAPVSDPSPSDIPPVSASSPPPLDANTRALLGRMAFYSVAALAVVGVVSSSLLWQKLSSIQEQLARQSADTGTQAIEARTLARQAQEQTRDFSTRLSVAETRLSDIAAQRGQLEALMQSVSRSRDENLVADIESVLRMAQQQAQLTGSLEPLAVALKTAQQRIERAAQPRLAPLQRAITRDVQRVTTATATDVIGLLTRLDDLVRQVDELPLQNDVAQAATTRRSQARAQAGAMPATGGEPEQPPAAWWQTALQHTWDVILDEARSLVRVGRIDQPDAVLLAPDQAFFLRENLKLKLLNARLGVLARQLDAARADLAGASAVLQKYFDPASRRTQNALTVLQQAQAHMKTAELPRLDETLAALSSAAAAR